MYSEKWTTLRCKNKDALKTRVDNNYLIEVPDVDALLMTKLYFKKMQETIALLEEKEKRLIEFDEVMEHNPLLVRDFKVAKANMDYEKKTAR